ncbi:MAG TPA: hypothetical protein VHM19_18445 [Polyangiales bacterium]|jgi:hypothetical protein|nr:hypothetical protein [Polyangiales bacterium]
MKPDLLVDPRALAQTSITGSGSSRSSRVSIGVVNVGDGVFLIEDARIQDSGACRTIW